MCNIDNLHISNMTFNIFDDVIEHVKLVREIGTVFESILLTKNRSMFPCQYDKINIFDAIIFIYTPKIRYKCLCNYCDEINHIMDNTILTKDVDGIDKFINDLSIRMATHDQSLLCRENRKVLELNLPIMSILDYGSEVYQHYFKEIKPVLETHYSINPHHPEHYENGICGMNIVDLSEMLIDWYAASKAHINGDIIKSIEVNQERFNYSEKFKNMLIRSAELLKKKI